MNLMERLDRCRVELDKHIDGCLVNRRYDLAAADMREVIEAAQKRIKELEACPKP